MNGKQLIKLEQYLRKTGKFEQELFTLAELEELAQLIGADVVDVMFYLRYER